MSVLFAVAEAVADELNAFAWGISFTAGSNWGDFDLKLDDADTGLRVDVVPAGHEEADLETRGSLRYRTKADVVLRYRFQPADNLASGRIDPAKIEALALLAERFVEFLESPDHRRLIAYVNNEAAFASLKVKTLAPRNYLRDHRQFLAILQVSYHVSNDL